MLLVLSQTASLVTIRTEITQHPIIRKKELKGLTYFKFSITQLRQQTNRKKETLIPLTLVNNLLSLTDHLVFVRRKPGGYCVSRSPLSSGEKNERKGRNKRRLTRAIGVFFKPVFLVSRYEKGGGRERERERKWNTAESRVPETH